ncbi:MAG: Transcription factor WhiB [Candidatus Saccharibacteria bacterium]|nr:Transcription factor WhiB [Candidatus Saccharibacteria bacterium]
MKRAINPEDPSVWMKNTPCVGSTDVFFGKQFERPNRRIEREAKARAACAGCAVVQLCRDYAHTNAVDGIWGGQTEEDRLISNPLVPLHSDPLRQLRRLDKTEVVEALKIRDAAEVSQTLPESGQVAM